MIERGEPFATHDMPPSCCPWCGAALDATSGRRDGPAPKPGMLSLCGYCACETIFDEALRPRRPAPGELQAMFAANVSVEARVREAQRLIRGIDRRNMQGPRR